MIQASELSAGFWATWAHGDVSADDRDALERELLATLTRAREVWPGVELAPRRFAEALAERIDPQAGLSSALQRLHTPDVFLAIACAEGLRPAIEALEAAHLRPLRVTIARLGADAAAIDDILARLQARLLTSTTERPAVIAQYMGRGDLGSWLKVVGVREALSTLRKYHHVPAEDQEIENLLAPNDDPELEVMRRRYETEFRHAFQQALAELEPRERNVLRYHLIDRLNIDQIAAVHDVHRATAARWLARIRAQLEERTREQLRRALGVSGAELDSIIRLIQSQLDLSIGHHLAV